MTGSEFKTLRKALKLSQEQLGSILEVDKKTIINQEKSSQVAPAYVLSLKYLALREKKDVIEKAYREFLSVM